MGLETSDRDEAIKLAVDRLVPMAQYENLCVKASAVPTYLAEYPLTWAMPHVSRLVDAFGPHRVFWGSDLSRLDIPYRELVDGFADGLRLTAPDRALVMGGALRAWLGWSPSPPSSTGAGAAQP
jgi:predicted TIM-barrel fold metal-dependent hydrolase